MAQDNSNRPLTNILIHNGKLLRERVTSALQENGIHLGQSRVLIALLRHGKLTQGAIANGLNIKPATVTNQVKKLEAAGLINRMQDTADDRIMNVTLTQKGRAAANFAASVKSKIENEICSGLTQKEINTLRKHLEKMRSILGGTDPGFPGI